LQALLTAIGSHGDVHPFAGLGLALRSRGHHVTIMANGSFDSLVRKAGMDFIPLGTAEEFKQTALNPDLWHPRKGFKLVAKFGILDSLRPVYDAIAAFQKGNPNPLIVGSSLAFAAVIAHEKLGVPAAMVHLAPSIFRSAHESPKFVGLPMPGWLPPFAKRAMYAVGDRMIVEPAVAGPLNAFRAQVGLPTLKRTFNHHLFAVPRVIGMFPAWFAAPQPDWPPQTRLTGFPLYDERDLEALSPELEAFLNSGDPPVAFTPGSAMFAGQSFLRESARACALIGRRGILLTRHREQVPADLPPGVIHADYAPFSLLLPRCAAAVHHGGIGSTSQGLAAGVPQLLMPMAHDQLDNACRVKRLNAGEWLTVERYKAPRVAAALRSILESPAIKTGCAAVAARFKGADSLGETCQLLEEAGRW
jgi:rhamnosyltransferase subunit B